MISVTRKRTSKPEIGELSYDHNTHLTMVYNGVAWISIAPDAVLKYCQHCNKAEWSHNEGFINDHPFISNNLEFLEWKAYAQD
jgi:hypothetical protein